MSVGDRMSVGDTESLWATQNVCGRRRISVGDTECLWETQNVCGRHRASVGETECPWETQNVRGRHSMYVPSCFKHVLKQFRTCKRYIKLLNTFLNRVDRVNITSSVADTEATTVSNETHNDNDDYKTMTTNLH